MSILVALLAAAGIFCLWMCSVSAVPRSWALHFLVAAFASLCLGIAAGLFYALLDMPLVWP